MATQPKVIDFELLPELKEFQEMTRRFAREEIAPHAVMLDREQRFPKELVQKAGEFGLLKMTIPSEYGGTEMGSLASCIMLEGSTRHVRRRA